MAICICICVSLPPSPPDGLLFPFFAKLSKRSVPVIGSILTGVVTAIIAFFIGLEALADAISIGTLFAFSVVDAGVIVQRCVRLCVWTEKAG